MVPLGNLRPGVGDRGQSGVITVEEGSLPRLRTPQPPEPMGGLGPIPLFVDLTGSSKGIINDSRDGEMRLRGGDGYESIESGTPVYSINSGLVRALVMRMKYVFDANLEIPIDPNDSSRGAVNVRNLPISSEDRTRHTLGTGYSGKLWSWDSVMKAYGGARYAERAGATLRDSYYIADRVFATLIVALGVIPIEAGGLLGVTAGGAAARVVGYAHCALVQEDGQLFEAELAMGYTSTNDGQWAAVWPVKLDMVGRGEHFTTAAAMVLPEDPREVAGAEADAAAAADAFGVDAAASGSGMGGKFAGGRRKRKRTHHRRRTRRHRRGRRRKRTRRKKRRRKTKRRRKLRSKRK